MPVDRWAKTEEDRKAALLSTGRTAAQYATHYSAMRTAISLAALAVAYAFFLPNVLYALLYMALSIRGPDGPIRGDPLQALYFSIVTFTTLGYGDIAPVGLARAVACSEALLGAFMMALFIFVFCRRMVR